MQVRESAVLWAQLGTELHFPGTMAAEWVGALSFKLYKEAEIDFYCGSSYLIKAPRGSFLPIE